MTSKVELRTLKPARDGQRIVTFRSQRRRSSTRISAACQECKKRKTKCTGGPPPCQLCKIRSTNCVTDVSQDMRRREGLQRVQEESQFYRDTLNGILDCIREGSVNQLDYLLGYIRCGTTIQDISDVIHHDLPLIQLIQGTQPMLFQQNPEDWILGQTFDNTAKSIEGGLYA